MSAKQHHLITGYYFAHLLLFYLIFIRTKEKKTDSTAHPVPPVVGHGISKTDSAIGLKSYGSPTLPPPSDVPTKKGNDAMAGNSLSSPSCDVAGKNDVPKERLPVTTNTHGQDKVPTENKHSATNSR